MVMRPMRRPGGLAMRLCAGVLLALALTLALYVATLQPTQAELRTMALLLSGVALAALAGGLLLTSWGWPARVLTLRWLLVAGTLLSCALAFGGVWAAAQRLFSNPGDMALTGLLLTFAAGICATLGLTLAALVGGSVGALDRAAQAVDDGNLAARVELPIGGELGALAATFNRMAGQLETVQQRQQETERLRRDLVGMVGSDLRAPLASVHAMLQALNDGAVEEPATATRSLRTMEREVAALAQLAANLHDVAQIDAGGLHLERRIVNLSDLISQALERFSVQAFEKNVALHGEVGPGVDPVACDPALVVRVLHNLMENALRYTPPLGQVRVSALATPPGFVQVTVADTGPGIPPGELSAIFNRFYRVERSSKRTPGNAGLGLAIAQGIVQAHGGSIRAESGRGPGARIIFTLPKGVAPQRAATGASPSAGNPLVARRSR